MQFGILSQRTTSLLTGSVRENPIQPLRSQPGLVQIGSLRVKATFVAPELLDDHAEAERVAFNEAKQGKRRHECAASEMGMFCGHAV
jgi:hypothetical protein